MGSHDKGLPLFEAELPAAVRAIESRVRDAGGEVYVVGGAVRDALRDQVTSDWDLATSLRPDRLATLFPDAVQRDLRLGAIHIEDEPLSIAITSYREEGDYRDHRHPGWVKFVDDPSVDAVRRDFTVNAIYADALTGKILDPCGGIADLRGGVLRVIGDPTTRLREDPLRMLRAVRFAASLGLTVELDCAQGIAEQAPLVRELSAERVFEELTRMFTGVSRGRALRLLVDLGLAAEVLPEVVPMDGVPQPPEYHPEGDVLTHVCLVLDEARAGDAVQAWSAVLHDLGKPATFEQASDRIRFSGHDTLSAEMAEDVLKRLHAPRELTETVVEVCRDHIRFATLLQMNRGKRERWMRSPRFEAHLDFHRADCSGSHGDLSIFEAARELLQNLPPVPPPPLLRGADLLQLGVPQGPLVGEILRAVQAELDALDSPDRETALRLLASNVAARIKDEPRPGR